MSLDLYLKRLYLAVIFCLATSSSVFSDSTWFTVSLEAILQIKFFRKINRIRLSSVEVLERMSLLLFCWSCDTHSQVKMLPLKCPWCDPPNVLEKERKSKEQNEPKRENKRGKKGRKKKV